MISPEDSEKMRAELETIRAELGLMSSRIKVLTAEVARMEKKLL